jgi:hypothetical protein
LSWRPFPSERQIGKFTAVASYIGIGSVVGATYLATDGSTPVHLTYENGGTGPGGDKYSGLDSFGRVVETLWKMGSVVKQNASYGYDPSSNRQ